MGMRKRHQELTVADGVKGCRACWSNIYWTSFYVLDLVSDGDSDNAYATIQYSIYSLLVRRIRYIAIRIEVLPSCFRRLLPNFLSYIACLKQTSEGVDKVSPVQANEFAKKTYERWTTLPIYLRILS